MASTHSDRLVYPVTRQSDDADVLHGVRVADPYRWLEDPDSPETAAWVDAQNAVTKAYFGTFDALRSRVRARAEQLYNYERWSAPSRRGEGTVLFRNSGLQNQDVMYCIPLDVLDADGPVTDTVLERSRALLDLNTEFPDGTTALGAYSLSPTGSEMVYGLSHGGSDWQTVKIRQLGSGCDLPETIQWCKFTSLSWTHDGAGVFYSRYPEPAAVSADKAGTETAANEYAMLWYHRLGTPVSEDVLVWAWPSERTWRFGASVSDDGEWLLIMTVKGTDPVNKLYYAHLPTVWATWLRDATARRFSLPAGATPPSHDEYAYLPVTRWVDNWEAEYDYVTNDGPRFYFRTNLSAPNYRIIAADFSASDAPNPRSVDVVRETEDVLDWAVVVADRVLLACYIRHCVNEVHVYMLPSVAPALDDGAVVLSKFSVLPLPGPGTISSVSGRKTHRVAFLKYVSFVAPGTVLRVKFDAPSAGSSSGFQAELPHPDGPELQPLARISVFAASRFPGFDPDAFEVKQEFVPSKDGTVRIPLFTVRKRGVTAGPRPTMLYGYGGFNISLQPSFSALRLLWLNEFEGVFALACIRGGGEYGETWHAAGSKHSKQNCFDDFVACGEHLTREGVTTPRQLGIMGGSNGGLLVLACALQRPDLFGAIVSQVPVTDMLRFHKFTIGSAWRGEYGYAEDVKEDFEYMLRYSPLHNVRPLADAAHQLPSTLITTADHDDRVVPLHSLKMIATLQAVVGSSDLQRRPLLVRVETKAGHGAGKPTSKVLDEYADVYAFLGHELGGVWHAS